jgi:hypothetical protein
MISACPRYVPVCAILFVLCTGYVLGKYLCTHQSACALRWMCAWHVPLWAPFCLCSFACALLLVLFCLCSAHALLVPCARYMLGMRLCAIHMC